MLARIALRIAVQEALRDKTLAGANVLDSQFSALDLGDDGNLRTDQDKPFISVYTDGGTSENETGTLPFFTTSTIDLVIEAGVSTAMLDVDPNTGASVVVTGIPDTEAGFELMLDVMMRQVADALMAPDNDWAVCVSSLFEKTSGLVRTRIGVKSGGTRIAAQEVRLTGELIADPFKGQDLDGAVFGDFLDLLKGSGEPRLLAVHDRIRALLAGEVTEWESVRQLLGVGGATLRVSGAGLLTDRHDREPETFEAEDSEDGSNDP